MRRILLDQIAPRGVRQMLAEHHAWTAYRAGWATSLNGDLLLAAQQADFQGFVTCGRNIEYQISIGLLVVCHGSQHDAYATARFHSPSVKAGE